MLLNGIDIRELLPFYSLLEENFIDSAKSFIILCDRNITHQSLPPIF